MSRFVTRPPMPEPLSDSMFTLWSCAMRRTRGDDFRRRRSSTEPGTRLAGAPLADGYGERPVAGDAGAALASAGADDGAAGAATAPPSASASPAAPIRPTTLSTATVSPSLTLI